MKKLLAVLLSLMMLCCCTAFAETAAPEVEVLSGIDMILFSCSDLENTMNFFVKHMELNKIGEGTLTAEECNALYGMNCEARYTVVVNDVNVTKLVFIEFADKPTKAGREGCRAWDYGYFDLAWRCNDIDAMYEELTADGYSFECEPFSYTTSWSGNAVAECVAYGPDLIPTTMILKTTQEFDTKFLNMVDSVIVVDDMDSASAWYTNVMGMALVYDQPVEKGLVDRVLGIEGTDITVRMGYFQGTGANGKSPLIEILDYSAEDGFSMTETGHTVPANGGMFAHAFQTADLDALLARAADNGYAMYGDRVTINMDTVGEIDTAIVCGVNGALFQFYQVK